MVGEVSAPASLRTRSQMATEHAAAAPAPGGEPENADLPSWPRAHKRLRTGATPHRGVRLPADFSQLNHDLTRRIYAQLNRSDRAAVRESSRALRAFANGSDAVISLTAIVADKISMALLKRDAT